MGKFQDLFLQVHNQAELESPPKPPARREPGLGQNWAMQPDKKLHTYIHYTRSFRWEPGMGPSTVMKPNRKHYPDIPEKYSDRYPRMSTHQDAFQGTGQGLSCVQLLLICSLEKGPQPANPTLGLATPLKPPTYSA